MNSTSVVSRSTQSSESSDLTPSSPSTSTQSTSTKISLTQEFQIFCSTFFTIFLAELGDKTQVTTLLMSAESHSPWLVFTGAGAALITTSLLGVLVGRWLSNRISPRTLEVAAAVVLLIISVTLMWDVVQA